MIKINDSENKIKINIDPFVNNIYIMKIINN